MKGIYTFALLAALAASQAFSRPIQSGPASARTIEVVVKDPSGIPVVDVDVFVIRTSGEGGEWPRKTDANGRIFLQGVTPGDYRIRAMRQGFFAIGDDGRRTSVAEVRVQVGNAPTTPGENYSQNQRVRMKLLPGGVLSGRVQDVKGLPISGVRVTAMSTSYDWGVRFLSEGPSAETDDHGAYRLFWLPAGDYYVRIEAPLAATVPEGARVYGTRVYYPGVARPKSARVVAVHGEKESAGIDFDGVVFPRGVTISGTVIRSISGYQLQQDGDRPSSVSLSLMSVDEGPMERPKSYEIGSDSGKKAAFPFEIRGVPPGTYDLDAFERERSNPNNTLTGRIRIKVGDKDIRDVNVALKEGTAIHARMVVRGPDLRSPLERICTVSSTARVAIFLPGIETLSDLAAASWDEGGSPETGKTFTIAGGPGLDYRLVWFLPWPCSRDAYLADMIQDGRSVYDEGAISVGSDPVELELVVNRNGGTVQGKVDIPPQDNVFDRISVVLVPAFHRQKNVLLYKSFPVGEDRSFRIEGIAPGSYTAFAWEGLRYYAQMNPEFVAQYHGVSINVSAGTILENVHVPLNLAK